MTILIVGTALTMLLRSVEEFGRSEVVRLWWRVPLVILQSARHAAHVHRMLMRLEKAA